MISRNQKGDCFVIANNQFHVGHWPRIGVFHSFWPLLELGQHPNYTTVVTAVKMTSIEDNQERSVSQQAPTIVTQMLTEPVGWQSQMAQLNWFCRWAHQHGWNGTITRNKGDTCHWKWWKWQWCCYSPDGPSISQEKKVNDFCLHCAKSHMPFELFANERRQWAHDKLKQNVMFKRGSAQDPSA